MKTNLQLPGIIMAGILFSFTLLSACKKDTPGKPDHQALGDYLLSETYQNGILASKHQYNGQSLIEKSVFYIDGKISGETTYTYDNQNRLIATLLKSDEGELETKMEYNNSSELSKTAVWMNGTLISSYLYSYSGNTIVASVSMEGGLNYTHTYTRENGNIIKEEADYPSLPAANWTLTRSDFDTGKTATFPINHSYMASLNNPGREIMSTSTPQGSHDWKWEYTYNEDGYVTGATSYDYQSNAKIDTYTYTLIAVK